MDRDIAGGPGSRGRGTLPLSISWATPPRRRRSLTEAILQQRYLAASCVLVWSLACFEAGVWYGKQVHAAHTPARSSRAFRSNANAHAGLHHLGLRHHEHDDVYNEHAADAAHSFAGVGDVGAAESPSGKPHFTQMGTRTGHETTSTQGLEMEGMVSCRNHPIAWPVHATLVNVTRSPRPHYTNYLLSLGYWEDEIRKGVCSVDDYDGKWAFMNSTPQVRQFQDLGAKMEPGRVFVDVGANIGKLALAVAALGHRVMAFEPVPYNVHKLCEGVTFNLFHDKVEVYPYALGSARSDAQTLWVRNDGHLSQASMLLNSTFMKQLKLRSKDPSLPINAGSSWKRIEQVPIQVKVRTLDETIPRSVKLGMLKVDTQGYDLEVLRGATALLNRSVAEGAPAVVIFEYDLLILALSNIDPISHRHLMRSLGYTCRFGGRDGRTDEEVTAKYNEMRAMVADGSFRISLSSVMNKYTDFNSGDVLCRK